MNVLDAKFTGPLAPYVSTISFYRGDVAIARRVLADRVGAVLEANPWLGGSIGTDAKGRYALKYARGAPPAAARHFVEAAIPELGPSLGPEAVKPLLAPLALPRGVRHDGPLFRIALVTGGDADHFAVVVDASHALGDGATYYNILNMLGDGGAPVSALDPVRPEAFDDAALAAALGKGYAWWWSFPRLFAVLCGALSPFGDCHRATYLVNRDWIERQKRDHAPPGGFVSTNDVVTSFLAKGSGCAHLMMAVDLRGRAAGATRTQDPLPPRERRARVAQVRRGADALHARVRAQILERRHRRRVGEDEAQDVVGQPHEARKRFGRGDGLGSLEGDVLRDDSLLHHSKNALGVRSIS